MQGSGFVPRGSLGKGRRGFVGMGRVAVADRRERNPETYWSGRPGP